MRRHIDVQDDWSWAYCRAPNAIDIAWGFNVPVRAPTRGHSFYGYSEKPPDVVAFYDTLG